MVKCVNQIPEVLHKLTETFEIQSTELAIYVVNFQSLSGKGKSHEKKIADF